MVAESELIDVLILQIKRGRYKAEDQLPSENELARKYDLPRISVRRVYEKLEQMGYSYSKQGKGRYVCKRMAPLDLVLTGNESFTSKMKSQGYPLVSRNRGCKPIAYNKRIYERLEIPEEDSVYKIVRERRVDDMCVAIHISYVAQSVFPEIAIEGKEILSMFAYYARKGFDTFADEPSTLSVAYGSEQERKVFGCLGMVPLLTVEGRCRDQVSKQVLEYTQIKYRGDCFKYKLG